MFFFGGKIKSVSLRLKKPKITMKDCAREAVKTYNSHLKNTEKFFFHNDG